MGAGEKAAATLGKYVRGDSPVMVHAEGFPFWNKTRQRSTVTSDSPNQVVTPGNPKPAEPPDNPNPDVDLRRLFDLRTSGGEKGARDDGRSVIRC